MHLAFYKGSGGIFNRLIRWWTRSQFSHVELAWPTGKGDEAYCVSSSGSDGGTRAKVMDLPADKWELVEIGGAKEAAVRGWIAGNLGRKYDWAGIFGMVLRPHRDNPGRYFCSEFCLSALQAGGWGRGLLASKTSPGDLYFYARSLSK